MNNGMMNVDSQFYVLLLPWLSIAKLRILIFESYPPKYQSGEMPRVDDMKSRSRSIIRYVHQAVTKFPHVPPLLIESGTAAGSGKSIRFEGRMF
jgi:hypothetical protein